MKNILFYKYVKIDNVEEFREQLLEFCKQHNLLGKILLAEEGINGCMTGQEEDTEAFKQYLTEDDRFSDVVFKEGNTEKHGFKKMFVRIKEEIIGLKQDVDVNNRAPYVEPKELKEWLDSGEEVIMIDARNDYESKIGKFKNAIAPQITVFRDWPKAVKEVENLKEKKIVTYCTGGIRCEKASAYMKEQGFKNVYQLHGGILMYGKENGDAHWEGKCFVFDKRGAVDLDPKKASEPISQCVMCYLPADTYNNCKLQSCDKMFISCDKCFDVLNGACSKNCRGKLQRVEIHG